MTQSVIRLDWDNITMEEANRRCNKLSKFDFVSSLSLFQSSLSGYHCYVSLKQNITVQESYRFRRAWKDDGRRLINDILFRERGNPKDVLFSSKTTSGLKWSETFVRTYD